METDNHGAFEAPHLTGDRAVGTTTTLSRQSDGRYRTTIPAAIRRALALNDRGIDTWAVRPRCMGGDLVLDVTLGPAVGDETNATSALSVTDYQAQGYVPAVVGHAWALDETTLSWPDVDGLSDTGPTTLSVGVDEWTPRRLVDGIDGEATTALATVADRGDVTGRIPVDLAHELGLAGGQTVGWACTFVGGQPAIVIDAGADGWPSLTLQARGPEAEEIEFDGRAVATALGVRDAVDTSVGLEWSVVDGAMVGVLQD
jgi:hypothetical protein